MTLLIRVILISLIIYLIIRSFVRYSSHEDNTEHPGDPENRGPKSKKGIPKEIGEYIDYEETKKK